MKTFTTFLMSVVFSAGSMAMTPPFESRVIGTEARHFNNEPIRFMERDIEFYVFMNGEFDFNTRPFDHTHVDYHYRRGNSARPVNHGVRIETDAFGRVRRVGNVFINYDHLNRVSRIGSVFVSYNRNGLSRVGGMSLIYNRRGMLVGFNGLINPHNRNVNTYYGPAVVYTPGNNGHSAGANGGYYFRTMDTNFND